MRLLGRRTTRRCLFGLLFATFIIGMVIGIGLVSDYDVLKMTQSATRTSKNTISSQDNTPKISLTANININHLEKQSESKPEAKEIVFPQPSYEVHAFYYPWYGSPSIDNKYLHWNHPYMPHWDKREAKKWPKGRHEPPDDIGSNYYPELGPYSSRDPHVIENHMQQLRTAAIGTISVSWYPPGHADDNGDSWDEMMPLLMDIAQKYRVKVCFHIEPYKNRNEVTMRDNVKYIIQTYGQHPAFYRYKKGDEMLPLFYIYDSYLVDTEGWKALLSDSGSLTIRNTEFDAVMIGLIVEEKHKLQLLSAGFDGMYTYFASDGFSFGSTTRHWKHISKFVLQHNALFIPSVGPGYIDERVRPWNMRNTKRREKGGYYEQSFKAAIEAQPRIITITSFNEWHEGTQIEKAVPKETIDGYKYEDYSPNNPDLYLSITRKWIFRFDKRFGKIS